MKSKLDVERTAGDWIGTQVASDFDGDIKILKSILDNFLGSLGKLCSSCWSTHKIENFYKKGTRRDSKCRQCLLQDKKEQRTRKKAAKKRRPCCRVLDIDSFSISITPINQVDSSAVEGSFRQWIDFTMGK